MGSQISFVATNAIMMGFSGYFFGGFILVHLPFPLTNRFKVMLQSDIELTTLDPSYVSSVSWYFLVMFGLRSFMNLIFTSGVAAEEEDRMMQVSIVRIYSSSTPSHAPISPETYSVWLIDGKHKWFGVTVLVAYFHNMALFVYPKAQLGMGGQAPAGFDAKAAFAKEADSLDMMPYSWVLDDIEKMLLGNRYPHQSFLDDIAITKPKKMKRGKGNNSSKQE